MKLKKEKTFAIFKYFLIFILTFVTFNNLFSENYESVVHKLTKGFKNLDYTDRVIKYSEYFIGVPYKNNTLIGDKDTKEELVINFKEMDCFTYVDYVESLIDSRNFSDFTKNLKKVRYKNSEVSFITRNHFFYDWMKNNIAMEDITKQLFPNKAKFVDKILNKKSDGSSFLEGVSMQNVRIWYVGPEVLNYESLNLLQNGDYIGIYSDQKGLDVSHVGIFIKINEQYFFRHGSNRKGIDSVIDEEFFQYVKNKPGIIIYRNTARNI